MPKPVADFAPALEQAFRAEVSAVFLPKVSTAVLIVTVLLVSAWVLHRFFKKRGLGVGKNIVLVFAILFVAMAAFQYGVLTNARAVRRAALAEIPAKAKEADGLVQRLLADSTGTAVATESGTYLALAGEQVFLPKAVAEALQKELVAKNLRLP